MRGPTWVEKERESVQVRAPSRDEAEVQAGMKSVETDPGGFLSADRRGTLIWHGQSQAPGQPEGNAVALVLPTNSHLLKTSQYATMEN